MAEERFGLDKRFKTGERNELSSMNRRGERSVERTLQFKGRGDEFNTGEALRLT